MQFQHTSADPAVSIRALTVHPPAFCFFCWTDVKLGLLPGITSGMRPQVTNSLKWRLDRRAHGFEHPAYTPPLCYMIKKRHVEKK